MKQELKVWRFHAPVGEKKEMKCVCIIFDNQRKARLEQTKLEKQFKELIIEYYERSNGMGPC